MKAFINRVWRRQQTPIINPLNSVCWDKIDTDNLHEVLISWAYGFLGRESIINARDLFYELTGKVFIEDPFFSARIVYFFDNFLFNTLPTFASIISQKVPPHKVIQETNLFHLFMSQHEGQTLNSNTIESCNFVHLQYFIHSAFVVKKVELNRLVLQDLLQQKEFQVLAKPNQTFFGLEKSTILQGYLFPFKNHFHLSQGLILHSHKASKIIRYIIRQHKKQKNPCTSNLLFRLASHQLRYQRMKHVDATQIYAESKIAFLP